MNIIDPLTDSRWDDLIARHPNASAFHRRGWLGALKETYGYQPFVLTSAAPVESLKDGIVVCRISSWLTGSRLVSLPFTDHCNPLLDVSSGSTLLPDLIAESNRQHCKYVEFRPLATAAPGNEFQPTDTYYFHELDLAPELEKLFKGLHKDSIQRKIRRAEKEHLTYDVGRSEEFIAAFYHLTMITRRRHHLPPQPIAWFRNLARHMGDALSVRLARKNGTAVAALLTLRHQAKVIYKYGCSDGAFHQLGGMPFLFWKLIEESKTTGAQSIDFGRSEMDNEGLVAFKDKFGTAKSTVTYYRYPKAAKQAASASKLSALARRTFSILPDGVLSAAGRVLYRHIG